MIIGIRNERHQPFSAIIIGSLLLFYLIKYKYELSEWKMVENEVVSRVFRIFFLLVFH